MPVLNNQCCHYVKLYAGAKLISLGGNLGSSIMDTGSKSIKGSFLVQANKILCT